MTLRIGPDAQRDIEDAARWYEARETGLGVQVIAEIDSAFLRIEAGSQRYPVSYHGLRRALVRRFPYSIYFTENDSDIVVIAVLHQRRDLASLSERAGE